MRRGSLVSCFAVALACASVAVLAPERSLAKGPLVKALEARAPAQLDARIQELRALPPTERRAQLKRMTPEERRGIWFELKRTQASARRAQPPAKGSGAYGPGSGHAVAVQPTGWGQGNHAPAVVGTIVYDHDFPSIGFGNNQLVGNRFNTHTGIPVVASGTISTIQAVVVPGPAGTTPMAKLPGVEDRALAATTTNVGFVAFGPKTMGGGALALYSSFATATGVIDSVTFAGLGVNYTGSSFYVLFGDFSSSYIPVLGTGTTRAQGHHGVVGYTGGMGPNITGTYNFGGTLNAFVRVTGNIVPVELMKFQVE